MKFDQRMMQHLPKLASEFLKNEEYHGLKVIAEMMVGFSSGGWDQLGDDERERYLDELMSDFNIKAMGGTQSCWGNPDYDALYKIVNAEYKALMKTRNT